MNTNDEQRRKRFGARVCFYRKHRPAQFPDSNEDSWTQEHFSIACGTDPATGERRITTRQIQSIEQGKMMNLAPFVAILADTLRLTGAARTAFFQLAFGFYTPSPQPPNLAQLRHIVERYPYPVSVRSPLWELKIINGYHRALWGISYEAATMLKHHEAGPNLLALKFDDRLGMHKVNARNPLGMIETILAFLQSAQPYQHTQQFNDLIEALKNIQAFRHAWDMATMYSLEDIHEIYQKRQSRKPKYEIDHPKFGLIAVSSSRWDDVLVYDDLITSVNLPEPESLAAFNELMASVEDKSSIVFTDDDSPGVDEDVA